MALLVGVDTQYIHWCDFNSQVYATLPYSH